MQLERKFGRRALPAVIELTHLKKPNFAITKTNEKCFRRQRRLNSSVHWHVAILIAETSSKFIPFTPATSAHIPMKILKHSLQSSPSLSTTTLTTYYNQTRNELPIISVHSLATEKFPNLLITNYHPHTTLQSKSQ